MDTQRTSRDTGEVNAAGAVLDDDQGVDAPEQHGIHMDEIDRKNPAGLRGQDLLPGRPFAAGCGADPGIMQDLPHRGCSDRVAELHELALHPPVPPRRIIRSHLDHELPDRGGRDAAGSHSPIGG